jgi:hypothetical protein
LFHAGRRTDIQTDVTKLIVAFLNFANAPKKEKIIHANTGPILTCNRLVGGGRVGATTLDHGFES